MPIEMVRPARPKSPGAAASYVPAWHPHSSALLAPRPSVVEPIGHGLPTVLPSGQYSPTWQSSQESTLAEKLPVRQALQLVWPSWSWNEPAVHFLQMETPAASLAVPIGQGKQRSELLAPVIGW